VSPRPRILLTNDDGIHAEGLRVAAAAFAEFSDLVVVAPDRGQSACGHSLTLDRPLRLDEVRAGQFAVDGTPTDCVNLAVLKLLRDNRPDIVVSGVNFGPNLGDDVTYSGTISAAFEGALLNIPSIALSSLVGKHMSFDRCAAFGAALARWVLAGDRDPQIILNVNFPLGDFAGVRVTKLGKRIYSEGVIERLDPRGRKYYWIGGEPPQWHPGEGTDFEALKSGFVSITPLHLDLTHHESIQRLKPLEELLGHTPGGK
jgi:5'-nucleotidase